MQKKCSGCVIKDEKGVYTVDLQATEEKRKTISKNVRTVVRQQQSGWTRKTEDIE